MTDVYHSPGTGPKPKVLWEGPAEDVDIVEQGRLPSIDPSVGWDTRVQVILVPPPIEQESE